MTPIITQNNDTLFSNASTNIQWLLDGNEISGANGSYYVPTQTGYYSIKVNDGFCLVESAPFYYNYLSATEMMSKLEIKIYPNPVHDILFITKIEGSILKIFNTTGSLLIETINEGFVSVTDLKKGLYFLKIISNEENHIIKFIKD